MSYRNSEIESKWLIPNTNLRQVADSIMDIMGTPIKYVKGKSKDHYWSSPSGAIAQFLRVRELETGKIQITVKDKYKENSNRRIEVDVDSHSSMSKIILLFEYLLGPMRGSVKKEYEVFWFTPSEHTTVSAYVVEGYDKVVVEIETTSQAKLTDLESLVIPELMETFLGIEKAEGSLYDMFITEEVRK